jgi:hypothetical protein
MKPFFTVAKLTISVDRRANATVTGRQPTTFFFLSSAICSAA